MTLNKLWLTEEQDSLASALGSDASHLMLHHRDTLENMAQDWTRQTRINNRWRKLYGESAVSYERNSHFVLDRCGTVLAAGSEPHCMNYMQDGRVLVIRVDKGEEN
jgi:hypothetical protein